MVLGFWDIMVPIVGAPMAGGPGTPALAAAVSNAGGLGFIPGGCVSADKFAEDIAAARAATTGPLGVNLFVPQPSVADWVQLDYYAEELEEIADYYQVEVGRPEFDDDEWERKLEVVSDVRPELVSFTFGVPSPDVIARLGALGLLVMITVTSAYEAGVAIAAGADSLVVQGPDAGGHRGTFAPDMDPGNESLHELIDRIHRSHRDVPIIAAGGLATAEDVAGVLRRGAVAAQVGTALLLSDEAGTNPGHRTAMKNQLFAKTIVSRAFSGRYARGLENEFTRMLDTVAPLGYPEVDQMTLPIRRAAAALEDPNGMELWAGTAFRQAKPGPAADIIAGLVD
ncbi:dioxygenase [Mycobacterium bohemicum DSM 44277]|uniref:Probable nitronate monooxygenase n=2 Tax=Mycobacterium bohemicum TaxID=56425 RepID=A0A1X1R3X9_MYCBE|nr:nitronate monooxygenase [Mycobacterium bohemicum]MCV6968946.1 nitronate monooxygenase [Mycobacterium bohemicum]ORU98837.1 2-nitropropane dioxygenase [Mycobacterium bohemicum]CPR12507.1 dioxygenase [Mycobacterium bohemicum DSM 44277]